MNYCNGQAEYLIGWWQKNLFLCYPGNQVWNWTTKKRARVDLLIRQQFFSLFSQLMMNISILHKCSGDIPHKTCVKPCMDAKSWWGLCGDVHSSHKFPTRPSHSLNLCRELGDKPKWLPLNFGNVDITHAAPTNLCVWVRVWLYIHTWDLCYRDMTSCLTSRAIQTRTLPSWSAGIGSGHSPNKTEGSRTIWNERADQKRYIVMETNGQPHYHSSITVFTGRPRSSQHTQ